MSEPRCTFTNELGWMTPEHVHDCKAVDCAGCKPCSKSHCNVHSRCANHVEPHVGIYTCPRCIGKTKRHVRDIGLRYAELPEQYEFEGVESEVLNLHGPWADPEQWKARRARVKATYESRGWCDFPMHGALADDDAHHPLAVLGRWDIAIRESYGHTSDLFITISRAVDYLAGEVIDTFAHTDEFVDFAKEIKACLNHLEDVLALSVRPEQGAPCPTCRSELTAQDLLEDKRAPRLVKRYGPSEGADTWHCPREAAHWWSHADYRLRVDGDYLEHATALTAAQMFEAHGIKPGTLRKQAERGQVAKRGLNQHGQMTYDVAQARALTMSERLGA